ncbi:hypothetical protein ACFOKI_04315 [Sphingomonas qilianensis]|uniref:Uncharacterized protein n=1 Tax=Sphingomonas qilianensis TaxID=1736690 RepID=A0ABU9XUA4_9SPHN
MILLLLAAQAATIVSTKPEAQSWSILEAVPNEPCVLRAEARPDAQDAAKQKDVIVCARPLPSQKLPYPDEVVPDGPTPSNRELTGRGALEAEGAPCATRMGGCQVGFGPPIVPIVMGAVDIAKRAFAKKPDKSGRVPIQLDAQPTGRILP